jgi:hypothetical protein
MKIKQLLKRFLPAPLLEGYRGLQRQREKNRNATRTTEDIFTEIYAQNKWANTGREFDSGVGSNDERITTTYIRAVQGWLESIDSTKLTIVDLGCGDFRIGQHFIAHCAHYVGADIVRPLVQYNAAHFASPKVEFIHLNIIEGPLPDGDVCFLRQVLQHLSNDQVQSVLHQLKKYRWSVITEHHPSAKYLRKPNLDKPHGADIRLFDGSGVYLNQPPFSIAQERLRLLMEIEGHEFPSCVDSGILRTYVLSN